MSVSKKSAPVAKSAKAKSTKSNAPDKANAFLDAAQAVEKTWKEARKVQGNGGGFPDIDEGTFTATLTGASFGAFAGKEEGKGRNKKVGKPTPWFRLAYTISDGPHANKVPFELYRFGDDSQMTMEIFCQQLQRLGYETSELELKDLPELAEALLNDKPACQIRVKKNVGQNGNTYWHVYVNKQL